MSIFSDKKQEKKTIAVILNKTQYDEIQALKKKYKMTKSEVLRAMIDHCLEKEKNGFEKND